MDAEKALELLLPSFERYYTVTKTGDDGLFSAEAEFRSHSEQYFLVKAAKVADIDSNEFVYFSAQKELSAEKLAHLAQAAWERGLARVRPSYGHRNSDVGLIVLADRLDGITARTVKKLRFYKSYKFSIYGWSNFKLLVAELPAKRLWMNRHGADFKQIVANLLGGIE